jgi:hypothetical protein
MALTAEGKALTEANRVAQIAIAARAAVVAKSLWSNLDVADLDGSTPRWLNANVAVARRFFTDSVSTQAAYVDEYREAEIGGSSAPVVKPKFQTAEMRQALLLAGPVRVKMLVGHGEPAGSAYSKALTKYTGIMRRQVLSGGRLLIDQTTKADGGAIGWRRVSGGNPCSFCAMLVTRGPVYGNSAKASGIGGSGLRYHGHCGCTAEIVYGEWKPNEAEQRYIDEYEKAAQEANGAGESRTQDTVLHRMRSNGVFRDSPLSRNK